MEHESSLIELREMVDSLPDLTQLTDRLVGNHVEYQVGTGTALGFNLLSQDEVAVQRAFLTKGAQFPRHSHPEHEFLLVYEGSIRIAGDVTRVGLHDEDTTIPGGGVYIPPNTPHSVSILENCWMIGITIPAAKGYPGVGK